MSIVNIFLRPHRALIGVDTACGVVGGPEHEVNKIFPLGHVGAVMLGRGEFSYVMLTYLRACTLGPSLDDIAERLPPQFPAIWRDYDLEYQRCMQGKKRRQFERGAEIYLVGWSAKASRMCGWGFNIDSKGAAKPTLRDTDDWIAGPCHARLDHLGEPSTPEAMMAMARAQVQLVRDLELEGAIGGRLVLAELTPERLMIWEGGDLEAPASTTRGPDPQKPAWL